MNSKNIKVVDEHNIDRSASVMFAFDLEGSEYVSYSIERDEENSNIFVSKIIRNLDNSFSMLDIDDTAEKSKLSEIIKTLISNSVSNENDKLVGNSVTLTDGNVIKFINVNFNKEQRMNVQKTYITTVKKEVVRVAEKYYSVEIVVEQPKVDEIFPTVSPVVEPAKEVFPEPVMPVVPEPTSVVVEPIVVANPAIEVPRVEPQVVSVSPAVEPTTAKVVHTTPVVEQILPEVSPAVVEPITVSTPAVEVPKVESNTVVETSVSSIPSPVVEPVEAVKVPETAVIPTPEVIAPTPVSATVPNTDVNQGLVFNAAKETNLNAALGEVANSTSIPVENIQPVREFGVDEPLAASVASSQPVPEKSVSVANNVGIAETDVDSKKGGFANSKFFMVVAIAFFLASCVFLGYEVFNYFQLTK